MRKIRGIFLCLFALGLIFSPMSFVFAAESQSLVDRMTGKLNEVGDGYGATATETTFPQLVGGILKGVTGALSVFLVAMIFYAGYLYLTAGGDEGQVKTAKSWLYNGIIGLLISVSAYVITDYIVSRLAIAAGVVS